MICMIYGYLYGSLNLMIKYISFLLSAPGPVPGLRVTFANSSAMTVVWQPLPCIQQNGIVTAYIIKFVNLNITTGLSFQDVVITQRLELLQPPFRFTYTELAPSSNYAVQIQAINSINDISSQTTEVKKSTTEAGCKS